MIKHVFFTVIFIVAFAFAFPSFLTNTVEAAQACAMFQGGINDPTVAPPAACNGFVGEEGITFPPGFNCPATGYCKMPTATNGSYRIYSDVSNRAGLRKLVGVIYTVSQRWKKMHPNGHVMVGDLNAPGHASHKTGVDVDIYASTDGKDCVANYDDHDKNGACGTKNYNKAATVEFGKMFADTDAIEVIFYNDDSVSSEVLKYAATPPGQSKDMKMYYWKGHANHFHVRIKP